MKELSLNEVQLVTGAGILAQEFGNAGLGFGSALDQVKNGGTNSQIGSALGFGIGSVADGVIAVGSQLGNDAYKNNVGALSSLGPSFINAAGTATGSIIGSVGTAVGKAIGGVIGGIIPG
ncbi:hypothetical protein [Serratia marcescens]|uniref:hypothetical protein n=2 Tax=Serratia marcescens TaxID=615 RepID=UPI000B037284|nr:hypothetical protein [Serratia marcescens]HCB3601855.1 hypothetical protein [Serratia marcescens]